MLAKRGGFAFLDVSSFCDLEAYQLCMGRDANSCRSELHMWRASGVHSIML